MCPRIELRQRAVTSQSVDRSDQAYRFLLYKQVGDL